MTEQKAKIRKSINYLIRALIIMLTYGFIYKQVFLGQKLRDIKDFLAGILEREESWWFFSLIFLMMLVNWGLESVKWRILIERIEKLSFMQSFMAVMTGQSISLFTPNRTGDYLGRVFILKKGNHVEGIFATVTGSFAQIIVTTGVGLFCFLSFAFTYLREPYRIGEYMFTSLVFLVPCFVFVIILFYFRIGILTDFISRYIPGKWDRLKQHTGIFARYATSELLKVLLLSLLRYMIFSTQFYLLIRFFGGELPVAEGFILIPVIYLIMSMVPTMALTELGIRGSVAIFIIGLYFQKAGIRSGETDLIILAASSVLWLINLVLPAILGTFFVFRLKFIRK